MRGAFFLCWKRGRGTEEFDCVCGVVVLPDDRDAVVDYAQEPEIGIVVDSATWELGLALHSDSHTRFVCHHLGKLEADAVDGLAVDFAESHERLMHGPGSSSREGPPLTVEIKD